MSGRDAMPAPRAEARATADVAVVAADVRLDRRIGRLLQLGVLVAAAVTLAGGLLLLAARGTLPADLAALPRTTPPSSVAAVLRGALALDPAAVTQLGVVLLILTPVARVLLTLVAFVHRRDRLYSAMTAVVLVLLLWGVLFGT